jgi:cytochrome c-type biogenesis protein CcmH
MEPRRTPATAMVLLALAVLAGATLWGGLAGAAARDTVQAVAEGLTCQCGCGLTVANCNHPNCEFSVPARQQIGTMLDRGMSGAQILASFRTKYGEKVLSEPVAEGFNLLAWIVPFAAILAGAILILIALRRWRSEDSNPARGGTGASPAAYAASLRGRLEEELRRKL